MSQQLNTLLFFFMVLLGCNNKAEDTVMPPEDTIRLVKTIEHNDVSVDVVIDRPPGKAFDALVVYHGTVTYDSLILQAAHNALDAFKSILDRRDMLIVSVAYPEEGLLFGDNIRHAEAALLWLKDQAGEALGITINKVFLAGHSQGGYLVTRLNTMHATNGVIANGPGPLNLVFRCQLEENGQIPRGIVCKLLHNEYGSTAENPDAYDARSLLHFTEGYKADILFVQGLNDSPIQMYSWPVFKQQIDECSDCAGVQFLDLAGFGHQALFQSPAAKAAFNQFINSLQKSHDDPKTGRKNSQSY